MKLKNIVTFVSKSVIPQSGTTYNLYSLPSFDENKSVEVLDGAEIQSNKYEYQISAYCLINSMCALKGFGA